MTETNGRREAHRTRVAADNGRAGYAVTGMSCGHCAQAVTDELTEIAGVTDVCVDVSTGLVTVASENPLDDADVRAAVEKAGYQLAALVS